MYSLPGPALRLCDGISRREWLRVGSLGLGGLSLANRLQAGQSASPLLNGFGKAKHCILFCLLGGPPQHETWDPKPDAPREVAGPFKPISTSVPGLQVCELMPRVAKLAHHCAVLRAMATGDNAHSSSGYYMLTGTPHVPPSQENATPRAPNNAPNVGSIVKHMRPGPSALPAAVTIPQHIANTGNFLWPGQDAGWLGRRADPWLLHCDPNSADFQAPAVSLPGDLSLPRFQERRSLLDKVNAQLDYAARTAVCSLYDDQCRQAVELISSSAARRAFDIGREPAVLRERYGRHRWGQSVLLARRLVEAGVGLVQVNWTIIDGKPNFGSWDTHEKNALSLKDFLMPMMDQSFSALVEDLQLRGLLEETLVVWFAEFGRTPRHNAAAGRDHWGSVFSLALAGGGIRGGVVHGASDRLGAYPRDGLVRPQDLLATVFHCLGISADTELRDPFGRPIPVSRGQVIRQIV